MRRETRAAMMFGAATVSGENENGILALIDFDEMQRATVPFRTRFILVERAGKLDSEHKVGTRYRKRPPSESKSRIGSVLEPMQDPFRSLSPFTCCFAVAVSLRCTACLNV